MKLERYELATTDSLMSFEFISSGPKGQICKIIHFDETDIEYLFNLSFGDINPLTNELDDFVISNNGDRDKILATIVTSVDIFTLNYPDAYIYAEGSTKSRTRLYRMGITKYLAEIQAEFIILGRKGNELEEFVVGTDYDAFIVKRKI